jgi:Fe-S-cluster-containing dehydrogenase component
MACKNQYHQDPGIKWRDVHPLGPEAYPLTERAFYSLACMHCEKPACLAACPVNAYYKRPDGIVVLDRNKCVGAGDCIEACPYGAPKFNVKVGKSEKCEFCFQRQDAGLKPACVQGCPTGALQVVDLATFKEAGAVHYPPGFAKAKTNPSIRFRVAAVPKVAERKNEN